MAEHTISVRDLVAFCHREGDIDYRFKPSPTGVQGIQGHQHVVRNRPSSYQSEFSVAYELGGQILLRGRADGYDAEAGIVEEIKTTRLQPDSIPEAVSRTHLAQARLYAAMISQQENLPQLLVKLTWFNIDTEQEVSLEQNYSQQELHAFLLESLGKFENWLRNMLAIRQTRDESLANLGFPHTKFRSGQREIAELVYKCIDQQGQLMVEAPTGIGKTAAVLFPALKALARNKHDRVTFLTAKTVGRRSAEQTLNLFAQAGYKGRAISLSAKEKICLSPGKACHGDDCPYALSYYDRLPDAMMAAIEHPVLNKDVLQELAQRFQVCPYQLSLDLLPWIDLVIGDVHHLFGATGLLRAHMDNTSERWSVLIDEAHNLPSRARDMFSADLKKTDVMLAKKQAEKPLAASLARVNRALLELQKDQWSEPDFDTGSEVPSRLLEALRAYVSDCGEIQARDASALHRSPLQLDMYFKVLQFLRVLENWGEDFRFERMRSAGKQSLRINLNCLDPARLLGRTLESVHSVAAFSATLSPTHWMKSSLGLADDLVSSRQSSPFASDQLQVWVSTHIDTRYRAREGSLGELVELISAWLNEVTGNCIVYFPSYAYLRQAFSQAQNNSGVKEQRTLWVQERDQSEDQRDTLLNLLENRRDVAAFCILGGVFGEGIDLPGDRLSSVVIVGVGLPQINRDTQALREYFAEQYGQGYEYAFLYPGLQKVDQALGRVIRHMDDRGSALLIDPRYSSAQYRDLLPPWWNYIDYEADKSGFIS